MDTSIGLDEGRQGFPGCLRTSIAFPKGEDFPTLFMFVAGNTCHNVVSIDCPLLNSHLLKFTSGFVLQVNFLDLFIAQAPLIPGQDVGGVVVPHLFSGT